LSRRWPTTCASARALGFKLERAERLLAQFIAYLHDHNAEVPTIEDALAWARLPTDATPRWWAHRLLTVRGFAAHLHTLDARAEVPPPGLLRSGPRRQPRTCTPRPTSPRSSTPPAPCPTRLGR
jgi:integrase/recombinase XerD